MASEARVGFALMSQVLTELVSVSFKLIQSLWQVNSAWSDGFFGNFGAFMSRNFSSNAIRSNPRSISSLLYNKISGSDVRNLYGIQVVHILVSACQVISKVPILVKFIAAAIGDSWRSINDRLKCI
jgi:hypothetical protein